MINHGVVYLMSEPAHKHLNREKIMSPTDERVSKSFKTTAHQFIEQKKSKVEKYDYHNYA